MSNRSTSSVSSLSRGRRYVLSALLVLIVLTLLFIWGNSLLSREDSQQASDFVEVYIRPVLRWALRPFMTPQAIDGIDIRKLAHFGEYLVLGFELALLRYLVAPIRAYPILLPVLLPLLAACIDEALQFISRRGPSFVDVGIDWLGALTGVLLAWALSKLWPRLRRERGAVHA